MDIYIRPLREEDARSSWKWRNDPDIWSQTGDRPDKPITEEIELEWIRKVIADSTSRRYAICIKDGDEYIGNVQLTDITGRDAEFHIFIGKKAHWGKNVATKATELILEVARDEIHLEEVYLHVRPENYAAVRVYEKVGFEQAGKGDRMAISFSGKTGTK